MIKNIYARLILVILIFLVSSVVLFGSHHFSLFDGRLNVDLRELKRGLDLSGGVRITLVADVSKIETAEEEKAVESAKEIIRRRIDLLGVSEPHIVSIKTKEDYRIVVEIPGVEDIESAVALIGETAQLRFKIVNKEIEWSPDKFFEIIQDVDSWKDTGITGADLVGVDVLFGQQEGLNAGGPQIHLKFSREGREKFSNIAKENIGRPVGLFLDNNPFPLSAPIISEDLAEGIISDPVITGNFDLKTARSLSIQLRAGALPVPVKVLQQETIGATLGGESVQKSFFAGSTGLLIVIIFLIFKYGRNGVLASLSLLIYTVVVLAIFKIIPVVVTLPGIAGFILSIGMATDANILIFERIKEEIRWNKPKAIAIDLGFDRAWNSIKDSNISSLITSFILFQLGTGPVRGFALTLAIGILVSLFSSIFVVRTFIKLVGSLGDERV